MFTRLRSTWFAGTGAIVLVLSLSGAVLGASVLTATSGPTPEVELDPLVVDTSLTFEDLDGDGIDDDCDTGVVADADAAAAAEAAVDLDGDGTISVSEAAQSGRTGGKNCNRGGYVSLVAQATCDAEDEATTEGPAPVLVVVAEPESEDDESEDGTESEDKTEDCEEAEDAAAPAPAAEDAECVPVAAPTFDPATISGHGAFGAYVALVAQSDAVGGKNCNHGGAVSEAVKAAKAVVKAEREAARAAAKAERDAAKAERAAARAERAAQRAAAKAERGQSQGKGKGN